MLEEPDAQGHGPQQPVGVELGHPREQIDHRDLPAQGPQHPHRYGGAAAGRIAQGVQGMHPVQRHEHHQQQYQAHPVVVVEVRHPVDQLDIREPQKKQNNADPVKQAGRDRQAQQAQADEVHLHAPLRPRPHPAEAQIAEVVFRNHVQLPHPAVGNEAPGGCGSQETDRHSEYDGRPTVHLTHARAMQAVQHLGCLSHAATVTGRGACPNGSPAVNRPGPGQAQCLPPKRVAQSRPCTDRPARTSVLAGSTRRLPVPRNQSATPGTAS